jgi:ABC-type antimicrobial peptide transport system permease subunit
MDPIGRCIRVDEAGKECTRIVGIAESSPRMSLTEESALQYYLPGTQHDERAPGTVLLRMRPDRQANVVRTLDRELRALDPDGSSRAMRVAETLDRELRPWRLGAVLFGVCGVLALIVATLGIYSTVSYDVTQRRHELGVRAALGAQLGDVVRLVLSGGMRSVVVGVGLGIALSLAGGRFVEALLYGTSTRDPLVLAAIALALLAAGALACLVPAWRSGRVDPMEALRVE